LIAESLLTDWGVPGLFISALLSATLLPGSSEGLLLLLLGNGHHDPTLLWLAATSGNTLGGLINWGIGLLAARFYSPRYVSRKPRLQTALLRIQRHGSPILLLSWLPFVGDPLCVAAGWLRMRLPSAMLFMFIGKGLRYGMVLALPELLPG